MSQLHESAPPPGARGAAESMHANPAIPGTMLAWRVRDAPGPIEGDPLEFVEKPVPVPKPGEVLVKVLACGVCRTDLHVSEGDLPMHTAHVTPGHEIVGRVVAFGSSDDVEAGEATDGIPTIGERVGIPWLRGTCGRCEYCLSGRENLCRHSLYTGWDANGGYAQYTTAPLDYVYPLEPLLRSHDEAANNPAYTPQTVAPLLCAGIIGYRSLKRTGLLDVNTNAVNLMEHAQGNPSARTDGPQVDSVKAVDGVGANRPPVLGLYGFGGSAHITAQVALALGMRVHVLTRGESSKRLALQLGCASAGGTYDMPPEPLDAAIVFAPVGDIVPPALRALRSGGVLSLAGIHMSDVPALNYGRELFHEKEIRSVESNSREDGREFLTFARTHHIAVDTHTYPLGRGQRALRDLKTGAFAGAAVLVD